VFTVFISSTVFDLKDLRNILSDTLTAHDFKTLMSEEGTIPVDSSKHSYQICIEAAKKCDFLIAIIDSRFGGEVPGQKGKSITLAEIEAALDSKKKVFVFVRQSVWDAKETLRGYNIEEFRPSKIVEDVRVFDVIDSIKERTNGNWIFQFTTGTDLLRQVAEQLDFTLRLFDNPAVDQLDRILARDVLKTFSQDLMDTFVNEVQTPLLSIQTADEFSDAVDKFLPQSMRFAGKESSTVFDTFMKNADNLSTEASYLFRPSNIPTKYTSDLPSNRNQCLEHRNQIEKLIELASQTHKSWRDFFDFVRDHWPELIRELHKSF